MNEKFLNSKAKSTSPLLVLMIPIHSNRFKHHHTASQAFSLHLFFEVTAFFHFLFVVLHSATKKGHCRPADTSNQSADLWIMRGGAVQGKYVKLPAGQTQGMLNPYVL